MRKTWLSRRIPVVVIAGFLGVWGLLGGCSDDEVGGGGVGPGSEPITVSEIIFNPKALGPGDTLVVTAVVKSDAQNVGDFVTYEWTKSGGEWVDPLSPDLSSVRWRAPADRPGIYSFGVTARNSVSQASLSDQVFVGVLNEFIDERAGEMYTIPATGAVYYTSGSGEATEGLILRYKDAAGDEAVFSTLANRTRFSVDASRTKETHQFLDAAIYTRRVIVFDDLAAMQRTTIAEDERFFAVRWSEFTHPYISRDGAWICYQGAMLDQVATPAQGGVDTFAVFVHDVAAETARRATFKGLADTVNVSTSFYPTISSDNSMVVFISDRKELGIWEYYGLPIQSGGVVADTIPNALVELSDTGGRITDGSPLPNMVTKRQWCPDPGNPTLASVGTDKKLRLIHTGGGGARLIDVQGDIVDISWAPSGNFLVASVMDEVCQIYKIPALGGDYQVLWAAVAGDRMENLAVSNDGTLLVYTNKRGGNVWYELIETDRSPSDPAAVRITGAWAPRGAAEYGPPLQSLRPVWASTGTVVYLFFTDKSTPRVMTLDLSGMGG